MNQQPWKKNYYITTTTIRNLKKVSASVSFKKSEARVFEDAPLQNSVESGAAVVMLVMKMILDVFQTASIKEASLKCKQKQDQLDRKHKEVRFCFLFLVRPVFL